MIEKEHTAEVCLHIVELKKQSDLLIKKFREICEKVPPLFFGFGLSS
ncbi:hypothetical protein HMPREF1869_00999 [Bacteroidales bacterium KA00251]|nr:hypothetical protein HMPREF1869_00999 [Bacteroidales bacterium KA00251]